MTATILDGHAIAERIKRELASELARLGSGRPVPTLASVQIGDQAASALFIRAQARHAAGLGIQMRTVRVAGDVNQVELESRIRDLNVDAGVHGIFVQNPLPSHLDAQRISAAIDPLKDVEGIHPQNSARRFFGRGRIGSCTALAVMELIESTGVDLKGKESVVIGHSEIVGRPVTMLLLDALATTTVCHVGTTAAGRLTDHVKRAEVLVVAVGQPRLIKGEWIKSGAVVIDVGINVIAGKVVGDVEFEAAAKRAAFISPVPGGVGPVTVVMVMKNLVEAFKLQQGVTR